jgi:two-component system response regulator AtoC
MIQKVVLVSETPETCNLLIQKLKTQGVRTLPVQTLGAATSVLRHPENESSAIVLDRQWVSESDSEMLADIRAEHPGVPLIIFTSEGAAGEIDHLLGQVSGIWTFTIALGDPASVTTILKVIENATKPRILQDTSKTSGELPRNSQAGGSGYSSLQETNFRPLEPVVPLYAEEFLRRVGLSDVPVLLHGETGAGKEVMARKLWSYSNRVGKPFLKLNCAALPSELIESELFGYEKGAFTGATVDKPGKFEMAQDGTILLDEIGDMDTRLQAKLLQVLQDGEIQPLGSSRITHVNVRIMAATHRDLRSAIAQGTFREDLYYRLSVINITVPPLRERRDEIIPLAEKLLQRHVSPGCVAPAISESLRRAMLAHPWPGNVRELENMMRRFLVYQDAELLAAELTVPSDPSKPRLEVAKALNIGRPPVSVGRVSFDHFAELSRSAESKLLLETLEAVRWNRRQAALQLNIDYKALLYKLQKHGIVESKAKRREVSA